MYNIDIELSAGGKMQMKNFDIGFAKKGVSFSIEDKNLASVLMPNEVTYKLCGVEEVERALRDPIGKKPLCQYDLKDKRIVIVTSDITRPLPSYKIIPSLLDELKKAGADDSNVTVVFALGSHRPHTEEEMRHLVSDEVYERVSCVDSDASHCVHLGETTRGTPVDVFDVVANADFRICLGNIEFHYFAGYSGGMKAIMPGVSTRDAIRANHSHMVEEGAYAGHLNGNPVRDDIEEVYDFCPVDYIVNVVLNEKKEIICAVAGDVVEAHREGCKFLDKLYKCNISEKADIMVEILDTVYLIRLYSGGSRHSLVHFADEKYSVRYIKMASKWVAYRGFFGRSAMVDVAHAFTVGAKVFVLPPMKLSEEYEKSGLTTEKILLFNPSPNAVSYVTPEKTRIKLAFTGDEMHGMKIFTGSSFVAYADRQTRKDDEMRYF
jgi:nickel-dependent lactate racemase